MFLELLSKTCGYGHIKNVVGGIRYLHHTTGFQFPSESVWLDDTLQGLKRRLKGTPKQVLPIDPVILRRMFPFVNLGNNTDLAGRFFAGILHTLSESKLVPTRQEL